MSPGPPIPQTRHSPSSEARPRVAGGTTTTGREVPRIVASATLPGSAARLAPWPRVPSTIKAASSSSAATQMRSGAWPSSMRPIASHGAMSSSVSDISRSPASWRDPRTEVSPIDAGYGHVGIAEDALAVTACTSVSRP